MMYTPNSPKGKLEWVYRTYGVIDPLATYCTAYLARRREIIGR